MRAPGWTWGALRVVAEAAVITIVLPAIVVVSVCEALAAVRRKAERYL